MFIGHDGDLVLVTDNKIMMKGVDRNIPVVIDIDDKVTALSELDTMENKFQCIMRGLKSMIGEISNYATAYHNKIPTKESTKKEYENYIDLLSVLNGKAVDFAKTGVLYPVPRNISTYGRPLPYFMKYAGPYYSKLRTMSRAHSNMNMLCMSIERWERSMLYKKFSGKNFDWHIMFNDKVGYTQEHFDKIEEIFLDFNVCRKSQLLFEKKCKNWKLYRKELEPTITKAEAKVYETNWQAIYNIYRNKCKEVCPNINELANILVVLSYEKYPNKYKKFMWHMAGAGIVDNIDPKEISIPKKDKSGDYEYLGQKYSLSLPDKHYVSVKK